MTMRLRVEGACGYQAASTALFPSAPPVPQGVPLARQQEQPVSPAKVDNRLEVQLAELTFRHLRTADEIAGIVHLRKEIQLVAAGVADPRFVAREKKETRRASSPLSNAAVPSSARFA